MKATTDSWERLLDPDVVRPSLFAATIFITVFEILKDSVVDKVRTFYTNGFDEDGEIVNGDYKRKVLALNKSVLYASLSWLQQHEAIDEQDLKTFEKLKETRNQLAHQLFAVVTGQKESEHESQLEVLIELLRKIEIWWVVNFEIPLNSDFDGQEIDVEGIVPGAIL
jgi:hypothetical protein